MPVRHPAEKILFTQKFVRAGDFRTSWDQPIGNSESSHDLGAAGIQHTSATGPVRAHGDIAPGGHTAGTGPVAVSAAKRPSYGLVAWRDWSSVTMDWKDRPRLRSRTNRWKIRSADSEMTLSSVSTTAAR